MSEGRWIQDLTPACTFSFPRAVQCSSSAVNVARVELLPRAIRQLSGGVVALSSKDRAEIWDTGKLAFMARVNGGVVGTSNTHLISVAESSVTVCRWSSLGTQGVVHSLAFPTKGDVPAPSVGCWVVEVTPDESTCLVVAEGNVYGVPLNEARSSRKPLSPFGGSRWAGLGSALCLVCGTSARCFSGHLNGSIYIWDVRSGDLVASLAGHQGSVLCLATSSSAGLLYSVGSDGRVFEWAPVVDLRPRRSWNVGQRLWSELRVIEKDALLVVRSKLALCIVDLVNNRISHFILHSSRLLAWRSSGDGWIHTVVEKGVVSSWKLDMTRRQSKEPTPPLTVLRASSHSLQPEIATSGDLDHPPPVIIVPDKRRDLGYPVTCAAPCGQGFAVARAEGRTSRIMVILPPDAPLETPAPPCIVRVQAIIRRNLAVRGYRQSRIVDNESLRALGTALHSACLVEFGYVERLIVLYEEAHKFFLRFLPAWGNIWNMLQSLASAHLVLAADLAHASQSWPPPVSRLPLMYDLIAKRVNSLSSSLELYSTLVPKLIVAALPSWSPVVVRGASVGDWLFQPFWHLRRTYEGILPILAHTAAQADPLGIMLEQSGRIHRVALGVAHLEEKVRSSMLRNSYLNENRAWEHPSDGRRFALLDSSSAEWNGSVHRVVLCQDVLLIITPAATSKGFFSSSSTKKANQLVDCISLRAISVSLDPSRVNSVAVVDVASGNRSRLTLAENEFPNWKSGLERAVADAQHSRFRWDLKAALMEDNVNIPPIIPSLCACLEPLTRRGFLESWCSQRTLAEIREYGPYQFLHRIWRDKCVPGGLSHLLLLTLHYYLHNLPSGLLLPPGAVQRLARATTYEALEEVVASLPQATQVLMGHLLWTVGEWTARAKDPKRDRHFFAVCFARELVGCAMAASPSDLGGLGDFSDEVAAVLHLIDHYTEIWRIKPQEDLCFPQGRAAASGRSVLSQVLAKGTTTSGTSTPPQRWSDDARLSSGIFSMDSSRPNSSADPSEMQAVAAAAAAEAGLPLSQSSRQSGYLDMGDDAAVVVSFGSVRERFAPEGTIGQLLEKFLKHLETRSNFERRGRTYGLAPRASGEVLANELPVPTAGALLQLVVLGGDRPILSPVPSVAGGGSSGSPRDILDGPSPLNEGRLGNSTTSVSSCTAEDDSSASASSPPVSSPPLASPPLGTTHSSPTSDSPTSSMVADSPSAAGRHRQQQQQQPQPPHGASLVTDLTRSSSPGVPRRRQFVAELGMRAPRPHSPAVTRHRRSKSFGDPSLSFDAKDEGSRASSAGRAADLNSTGVSSVGGSSVGSTGVAGGDGHDDNSSSRNSSVVESQQPAFSSSTSSMAVAVTRKVFLSSSSSSPEGGDGSRAPPTGATPTTATTTNDATPSGKTRRSSGSNSSSSSSNNQSNLGASAPTAAGGVQVPDEKPLGKSRSETRLDPNSSGQSNVSSSSSFGDQGNTLKPSGSGKIVKIEGIGGRGLAGSADKSSFSRLSASPLSPPGSPFGERRGFLTGKGTARHDTTLQKVFRKASATSSSIARPLDPAGSWNSVKLVLVGEENVGKTHLVRQLENVRYELNMSTDGIDIGEWSVGKGLQQTTFRAYDFGGQMIFYPTHQLFLTARSLYLVVFRLDNPQYMDRVMYWLRTVETTVKARPAPPVLLVGTHRDVPSVTEAVVQSVRLALEGVARKHKIVRGIAFVSSTKGVGIQQLRSTLVSVAIASKLTMELVPSYYQKLYEAVKQTRLIQPVVSYHLFKQMAWSHGVPTTGPNLSVLAKFLHDAGCIMHFESDARLSELVVLDPGWLADRMADLISFKQNWPDGIVKMAQLDVVWKQYRPSEREEILSLLEKFGVIFLKRSNKTKLVQRVTIPSLLPLEVDLKEVGMGLTPALGLKLHKRVYTLTWLPVGAISRLIARFQSYREFVLLHQWRMGLVLSTKEGQKGLLHCVADYKASSFSLTLVSSEGIIELASEANTDGLRSKTLVHAMVLVVDAWLSDFYGHATRDIFCTNCLENTPSMPPGTFNYEVLMERFLSNKLKVECASCHRQVLISEMAPDLTFSHLPVLHNVTIGPLLGRGGFASVYQGTLVDGTDVAVKELAIRGDKEAVIEQFRQFQHEVYMMSKLSHPNIVQLHGVMVYPTPRLVLELCPHPDLSRLLYGPGAETTAASLTLAQKLRFGVDIASALAYLHSQIPPIVHRDVRSPNVFMVSLNVQAEVTAKLGDFGLASTVAPQLVEALTTFQWVAPEVLNGEYYDESVDVYSLSMVMLELVSLRLPFTEFHQFFDKVTQWSSFYCSLCGEGAVCSNTPQCPAHQKEKTEVGEKFFWKEHAVKEAIIQQHLRPTIPDDCPADVVALIQSGWSRDITQRPSTSNFAEQLAFMCRSEDSTARVPEPRYAQVRAIASMAGSSSGGSGDSMLTSSARRLLVSQPIEVAQLGGDIPVHTPLIRVETCCWVGMGNGEIVVFNLWDDKDATAGSDGSNSAVRGDAERMIRFTAHGSAAVMCLLFLPELELVLSGAEDGIIHAWIPVISWGKKKAKPKKRYSIKGGYGTPNCMVDAGGGCVVVGYESGALIAWDAAAKDPAVISIISASGPPVNSLAFLADALESFVCVGGVAELHIYRQVDRRGGGVASSLQWQPFTILSHFDEDEKRPNPISCLVSAGKELWATSGSKIYSFGTSTWQLKRTMSTKSGATVLGAISVEAHNAFHVWLCSRDRHIGLWDAQGKAHYLDLATQGESIHALVQLSVQMVLSIDSRGVVKAWPFV